MNINLSELLEKDDEKKYIRVLKDGANYVREGAKISEIFSSGNIPPQLHSYYIISDEVAEANQARAWWLNLSEEEQLKYDQ